MEGFDRDTKNHSQFIALVTAKIAKFSSKMVEVLIANLHNNSNIKKTYKNSIQSDEQNSKESDCSQKEEQIKRKSSKSRTKLPFITDSFKPKPPTSSFLIYFNENKKELAASFGENNVSRLTKLASLVWKQLPEEERMKYYKMSEESKGCYQKQMAFFKAKYSNKIEQTQKKRKTEYRIQYLTKNKTKQAIYKDKESQNNPLDLQQSNDDDLN